MRPEVVVVDGARHARRGLRCAIGTSSDAAAGWGRSGVAAAPAGASRAGVRVGGAMGAGAGELSHAGGTLTLTSGVRGGGVAGARSGGRAGRGRQGSMAVTTAAVAPAAAAAMPSRSGHGACVSIISPVPTGVTEARRLRWPRSGRAARSGGGRWGTARAARFALRNWCVVRRGGWLGPQWGRTSGAGGGRRRVLAKPHTVPNWELESRAVADD